MTTNSLDSLEDRIQKPGYLLFLVVVLLLLIVGFVDLLDHETRFPVILGRYTPRYFAGLIGYTIFTLAWASLLLKPNNDRWLTSLLDFLQIRPILAIGVLVMMGLFSLVMIDAGGTLEHTILALPALQVTVLGIMLLSSLLLLFYKWGDESRPQRWRKIVLVILGIIVIIELLLQAFAFFGILPNLSSTTESADGYSPYSRIYYTEEGFGNGMSNNYGRYAPPFQLLPDSKRVAILGDCFVEGLQVRKDQNFGILLQNDLAADDTQEQVTEVFPLGHPDLGPGIYLSNWMLESMVEVLEPDETIVFLDLGNDFQTVDRGGTGYPYFVYEGQGQAQIDTRRFGLDLHMAEHFVFRGYRGFQPVVFLKSNLLTLRLLWENVNEFLAGNDKSSNEEPDPPNYDIDLPNGFVFNKQTNENAMRIAFAQINMAKEQLERANVGIKLVTNPVFTAAFYEQDAWNTVFGDSDLLLPEEELRETAAHYGIPFLGLGAYMAANNMTPAEVQKLYFDNGRGHYTPAGHEFVAEAIYNCFYAQTLSTEAGCDLR